MKGKLRSKWLLAWHGLLGLLLLEILAFLASGYIASVYKNQVWDAFNASMRTWQAVDNVPYAQHINRYAKQYGISAKLVAAVMEAESSFQPQALSRAGAYGLMQVIPGTWELVNKEYQICQGRHQGECTASCYFDPELNIGIGTAYLSQLTKRFEQNIILAIAAYNAGPGAVSRHGGIPPYRETEEYVNRIVATWLKRQNDAGVTAALRQVEWRQLHRRLGWGMAATGVLLGFTGYRLFTKYRSWRWR
ncbi:MAG: lytic transglycosylase domain-containing protein [Negativicutes bacterium]|nr:lytic transglycosylase domain-containing protein [Negativicutes bacterium]